MNSLILATVMHEQQGQSAKNHAAQKNNERETAQVALSLTREYNPTLTVGPSVPPSIPTALKNQSHSASQLVPKPKRAQRILEKKNVDGAAKANSSSKQIQSAQKLSIESDVELASSSSFFDRVPSWLASAIVHIVLLVILASWLIEKPEDDKTIVVDAISSAMSVDNREDELETFVQLDHTPTDPSEFSEVELEINTEIYDIGSLGLEASPLVLPNSNDEETAAVDDAFAELEAERLKAELRKKEPPKATFLGVEAEGSKFVFVVDRSGSMSGARWLQARTELIQSIQSLADSQEFFIVLYNHQSKTMMGLSGDQLKLVKANKKNVGQVSKWLYRQIPTGNTSPRNAMRIALKLEPDAVFLLSDGEFRDGTVKDLQRRNRHRIGERKGMVKTAVHCIAFKSLIGAGTLQTIARENNGTYAFIR